MEQIQTILRRVGVVFLVTLGLFLCLSLLTHSRCDPPDSLIYPRPETFQNWCGKSGAYVSSQLFRLLGYAAYFLVLPIFASIPFFWNGKWPDQIIVRFSGFLLILVGFSGFFSSYLSESSPGPMVGAGGYLGITVQTCLAHYFATTGSTILYVSIILSGTILFCDYSLIRMILWSFGVYPLGDFIVHYFKKRMLTASEPSTQSLRERSLRPRLLTQRQNRFDFDDIEDNKQEDVDDCEYEEEVDEEESEFWEEDEPEEVPLVKKPSRFLERRSESRVLTKKPLCVPLQNRHVVEDENAENEQEDLLVEEYELPSIEHLAEGIPYNYEEQERTVQRQAKMLEKAFADYGFNIKVVDIQTGPVISQFEVQLERGLRLSKIMNLTDDLAVAMKVPTVRIVAPIPGKNTVGVEVPNANRQLVRLREVMEATTEKTRAMAIPIFLGKDVAGNPMIIDLAKMPHLLIAGRTGTGKSVCLNSLIVSMLMTRRPDECRMIMIDPKMVELSPYKTIPHLMHPVVTDMKKAEAILAWAVDKMEQRYQLLARAGVRQLSEFNKLSEEELYKRVKPESQEEWDMFPRSLPYMVIVADEMADLMMTAAKEVETHIIRIAAKSRAVGIHLVLATQKPTVDIITGLIKSNLPARIAFEVASRMDSQVVLDRNGAEKLLGSGDMLFLKPGTSQVIRGQGTYVSDDEINQIIESVGTDHPDFITELVELKTEDDGIDSEKDGRDDLYNEAVEVIIREGRGSVSLLQRKFKIGYGRAARLIDFMAEDGVVGPSNGSQAREVTITLHQWRQRLAGNHEPNPDNEEMLLPAKTIKPKYVKVQPVDPEIHETDEYEDQYEDEYESPDDDSYYDDDEPDESEEYEETDDEEEQQYEEVIFPIANKNMEASETESEEDEENEDDVEYEYVYEEWDGEEDDEDAEYEYVEYEVEDEDEEDIFDREDDEEDIADEYNEYDEEEPPFEVNQQDQTLRRVDSGHKIPSPKFRSINPSQKKRPRNDF